MAWEFESPLSHQIGEPKGLPIFFDESAFLYGASSV